MLKKLIITLIFALSLGMPYAHAMQQQQQVQKQRPQQQKPKQAQKPAEHKHDGCGCDDYAPAQEPAPQEQQQQQEQTTTTETATQETEHTHDECACKHDTAPQEPAATQETTAPQEAATIKNSTNQATHICTFGGHEPCSACNCERSLCKAPKCATKIHTFKCVECGKKVELASPVQVQPQRPLTTKETIAWVAIGASYGALTAVYPYVMIPATLAMMLAAGDGGCPGR